MAWSTPDVTMKRNFSFSPGSFPKLTALVLALAVGATACSTSESDDRAAFDEVTGAVEGGGSTDTVQRNETVQRNDTAQDAEEGDAAMAEGDDVAATEPSAVNGGFFESAPEEAVDREDGNTFQDYGVRSFIDTADDPLSTFALDVDTASYSVAQRWLAEGALPPAASVRVEEFVNSFDYDYSVPDSGLRMTADAGPSPFAPEAENRVIVRLGVQAEQVRNADRPTANLTFVVDTSGSMDRDDRLGLVKESLTRLVRELDDEDRVAIVTYGSAAEVILAPTAVRDAAVIIEAIDELGPGGSTNLEAGLREGYNLADEVFEDGEINRVILASDGVANVGLTDPDGLVSMIRDDADRGIQLITLGVGMGNFNDVVMETLADDGDGFYAYLNTVEEADRLFGDELVSSLLTVAIDGKIQVEFDEESVVAYRLMGFENRAVLDDDFRNDEVDAGELGAGHQVTALYELELADGVDVRDALGTASLRWEDPESRQVAEARLEITGAVLGDSWNETAEDFRLAVVAGAFAEILRQSQYAEDLTLAQVAAEAEALSGAAAGELAEMIRTADALA